MEEQERKNYEVYLREQEKKDVIEKTTKEKLKKEDEQGKIAAAMQANKPHYIVVADGKKLLSPEQKATIVKLFNAVRQKILKAKDFLKKELAQCNNPNAEFNSLDFASSSDPNDNDKKKEIESLVLNLDEAEKNFANIDERKLDNLTEQQAEIVLNRSQRLVEEQNVTQFAVGLLNLMETLYTFRVVENNALWTQRIVEQTQRNYRAMPNERTPFSRNITDFEIGF